MKNYINKTAFRGDLSGTVTTFTFALLENLEGKITKLFKIDNAILRKLILLRLPAAEPIFLL
jgi:hypothetical protein